MFNFIRGLMKNATLFASMFLVSANLVAADLVLLQAGKTFVQGIDEEKAKAIADNRDEVKKYSFDELKIKQGDTVDFRNVDSVKHNVFLEDQFNFVQPSGSRNKFQFAKKGAYEVKCAIHPKMKIKITVE